MPADYGTIQAAIDSSAESDTVLISEGTYFENIRYRGKAITVASLYLIDGDSTHIERTIIDGSRSPNPDSGSVVYFVNNEDTTSVLCGLTIQGGSGTAYLWNSGPGIWIRAGGGVLCDAAGARIFRNNISRNRIVANFGMGGGLCAFGTESSVPFLVLEQNRITDNYVRSDTSAANLWGESGGADIDGVSARVTGNRFERDSVTSMGGSQGGGMCLIAFTLTSPRPQGLISGNVFRNNILYAVNEGAVGAGLCVLLTGEVSVIDNDFEDNVGKSVFGWAGGGGLLIDDHFVTNYGRKITVRNRFLNNRVQSPYGYVGGGGLWLYVTLATVSDNEFRGNVTDGSNGGGAGMNAFQSSFDLENNIFAQNAATFAAGLSVDGAPQLGSRQSIINNTIVDNQASNEGGAMAVSGDCRVVALNNIFWANTPNQLTNWATSPSTGMNILFSDIQGGWPGEGNISADPRLADSVCRLSDSSACIGRGIDSIQIGATWYHAPRFDFSGSIRPDPPSSRPDMGAWEHPLAVDVYSSPLAITPGQYDFQNVRSGSVSDTVSLTIGNRGPTARDVYTLSLGRSEYRFAPEPNLPFVLAPYSSTSLHLLFTPTLPGTIIRDTLVVGTSDSMSPVMSVPFTGRGSGAVQPAQGSVLYEVHSSMTGLRLSELDKSTGDAVLNAQFSPHPPAGLCGLAVRRLDNVIYGAFNKGSGTDLYRLSSSCGDLDSVSNVPLSGITAMAFSPGDTLYMVDARARLYRMDGIAGDTGLVGTSGLPFTGLAFDPSTGKLWGSLNDSVFIINTSTAEGTFVGRGYPGVGSSSITFNPLGTLYGLYDNALVIIDRTTGGVTTIGSTGLVGRQLIAMRSDPAAQGVASSAEVPRETKLEQNYPNPFNSKTVVSYQLSVVSNVKIAVYDVLGREVAVLVNERKVPGSYSAEFDGSKFASGMYIYRLSTGSHIDCRKMVLMK